MRDDVWEKLREARSLGGKIGKVAEAKETMRMQAKDVVFLRR